MAIRKKLFQTEHTREKIRAAHIINRLHDYIDSKIEMAPAQVKAAQVLLAKVLPDLSAADITRHVETTDPQELYNKLEAIVGVEMAKALAAHMIPTHNVSNTTLSAESETKH